MCLIFSSISCKKDTENPTNNSWVNRIDELYSHNAKKITLVSGLSGNLTMKEGNCMPIIGTDNSSNTCKQYPVKRTIYIYEYTTIKDLEGYGPLFTKIKTNLVSTIETDNEGFFQTVLEIGKYSIFVGDNGKFYANNSDEFGGYNPIEITDNNLVILNLRLDYAVY